VCCREVFDRALRRIQKHHHHRSVRKRRK
jgi:hypothetical protein